MARKRKALVDDGRPLTSFALSLRARWAEEERFATVKEFAAAVGYSQPRLSELFNATKMPSEELVRCVVQALGDQPEPWLRRLREMKAADEEFQAAEARKGDTLEAKIARLEYENNRYKEALEDSDSAARRAFETIKDADARIRSAGELERQARALLGHAGEEFRRLHERIPTVHGQAEMILAEARFTADRIKLGGRDEHDKIIKDANERAEDLIRKAAEVANDIRETAIEDAKQHRAQAAESLDELLKEGDRIRAEHEKEARQGDQDRTTMVTRAKLEIELLINGVRKKLEAAGEYETVEDLERLLRDFNINGSHPAPRGRHARRLPQNQHSSPPAPVFVRVEEVPEQDTPTPTVAMEEPEPVKPLPRRQLRPGSIFPRTRK